MLAPNAGTWTTWNTSSTLVVNLGGAVINSIYVPSVPTAITVSANGVPFYVITAGQPQTIPTPAGTVSITCTAAFGFTVYIFVSSVVYSPTPGAGSPSISTVFDVKVGYGAVGDGVTDDSAAILAACAAATAQATTSHGAAELYFPPSVYYYNSPLPIIIPPGVSVNSSMALVTGGPNTTDCFWFRSVGGNQNEGNANTQGTLGTNDFLPSIAYFQNGKGLRCSANGRLIYGTNISWCLHGLSLEVLITETNYNTCSGNNITLSIIQHCTDGIYCFNDNPTGIAQGNIIDVNFMVSNTNMMNFDTSYTTAASRVFTINVFRMHAADPLGATGTPYIFQSNALSSSTANKFIIDTYCVVPGTPENGQFFAPNMVNHYGNYFECNWEFVEPQPPAIIGPVTTETIIKAIGGNTIQPVGATAYSLSTTPGLRTGGATPFTNLQVFCNLFCNLVLVGTLANGTYIDCYGYCDVLNGSSPVVATVSGVPHNLAVLGQDVSHFVGSNGVGPVVGMFFLRVWNNGADLSGGSTLSFIVVINGNS